MHVVEDETQSSQLGSHCWQIPLVSLNVPPGQMETQDVPDRLVDPTHDRHVEVVLSQAEQLAVHATQVSSTTSAT